MSACLSVTVMTSVDTMLNAATATISVRMMNIIRFSICTARKKLAWLRVQSRTSTRPRHGGRAAPAPPRGASNRSSTLSRTPETVVEPVELLRVVDVDQRQPGVELEHADFEDADHAELLEPRQRSPAGGDLPCGAISDHLVARARAQRARQLGAQHDAELAGLQFREPTRSSCGGRCRRPRPPAPGTMPRTSAPRLDRAGGEHRLPEHVGCGGLHPRMPCARSGATSRQSASRRQAADLDVRGDPEDARCAVPSGSRSSPTGRRSAPRRRGRCRPWRSAR